MEEFKKLLDKPESTIIDFKQTQYKFDSDKKTADFIKDIISFTNTIRSESAYIILGVRANEDGSKELLGISEHIDDSIFQEKIKDKVSPKPTFLYYTVIFENKSFGVFEIPIHRYAEPIAPVVKLKGLEVGKIYFRRGSSNSEAIGREIILINNWLTNLPDHYSVTNKNNRISTLLLDITSKRKPLSECLADTLGFANDIFNNELQSFCKDELTGHQEKSKNKSARSKMKYRIKDVLVTPYEFEINPYYRGSPTQFYNDLKKNEHVHDVKMFIPDSITKIEDMINGFDRKGNNSLATYSMSGSQFFPKGMGKDKTVTVFIDRQVYDNIYSSVRQKLINLIMAIE